MHTGIPDPVTDLKIITSSSTMANSAIISWKPPHTLDGIKLTYHVEVATCSIMNVADFDGTTLNHTLPHHNVSHAVNVKAVIDAGAGAATTHAISLPNFEVELITGTQGTLNILHALCTFIMLYNAKATIILDINFQISCACTYSIQECSVINSSGVSNNNTNTNVSTNTINYKYMS